MFSDDDSRVSLVLGLVAGSAALVIALVTGVVLLQKSRTAPPSARAVSPTPLPRPSSIAPAAGAPAESADSEGTSVIVQNGVVKFYFAPNQSALAAGGQDALTQVVKAVAEGRKAVVTGFHDSTGEPARNAELARQRALAVRNALNAMGVGNAQIELTKPEPMQASGSDAEARRVEIAVQ